MTKTRLEVVHCEECGQDICFYVREENVGIQHGGRREGAGRKPLEGRITAAFVLREDQVKWLEAEARTYNLSKSELVRQLIDEHLKRTGPMTRSK